MCPFVTSGCHLTSIFEKRENRSRAVIVFSLSEACLAALAPSSHANSKWCMLATLPSGLSPVSDFKNKQSQRCAAEEGEREGRERLIGSDVIFKLHAFYVSWISFKLARGETHTKKSPPNVRCSHIWAQRRQVTPVILTGKTRMWSESSCKSEYARDVAECEMVLLCCVFICVV